MLFTKSGKPISKIGIGTWGLKKNIKNEVDAMKYYHNKGINFLGVNLAYENGATLDVVAQFLKEVKREDIFVNGFITFGCKTVDDIEKQIDFYLQKLNLEYLDCVTLHALDCIGFKFEEYVSKIQELRKTGKFLNIGYSNISPEHLKKVLDHVDYVEGSYNLECKVNEDTKLIGNCLKNKICFYAFQPLRRNRTAKQNYPELVALANKYQKTQNQILINWMIKHKKIGILIKSSNKKHIKENVDALNFEMSEEDYKILDDFRNKEFDKIKVVYSKEEGEGIIIAAQSNQPIGIL